MDVLTGELRERERRLILDGAWPHFPILPVKRNGGDGHDDLGLLVWRYVPTGREKTAGPWKVYRANLVEVSLRAQAVTKEIGRKVSWGEALTEVETYEYPTLDDFFDAGWMGD
jgi:hypothetical protein